MSNFPLNHDQDVVISLQDTNLSRISLPKYCVQQDLIQLMKILRVIGSCPFEHKTIDKSERSNRANQRTNQNYAFKFFSWITFYSILLCLGRFLLFGIDLENWTTPMIKEKYANRDDRHKLERWMVDSMSFSIPIHRFWTLFGMWLTFKTSMKLMENWEEFDRIFSKIFSNKLLENEKEARIRTRNVIMAASVAPPLVVTCLMLLTRSDIFQWTMAYRVLVHTFLACCMALEEGKVLLELQIIAMAFRRVRKAIGRMDDDRELEHQYQGGGDEEEEGERKTVITTVIAKDWSKIIKLIRRQVKLTSRVQAPHQIILLLNSGFSFTESFYLILVSLFEEDVTTHVWISGFIASAFVVRIIFRICIADRIKTEEFRLVEQIDKFSADEHEIGARIELKKLIVIIVNKPSQLSLGGFVVLEKRLLPRMAGYILAYLAVLFQVHLAMHHSVGCHDHSFQNYSCTRPNDQDMFQQ